jgi:hypothetical protein
VRETLRRWDSVWVPTAAAALRRSLGRVHARLTRPGGLAADAGHAIEAEPALAGSIGAVLVAAILLATVGEGGPKDEPVRGLVIPTPPPVATETIGPAPGGSVEAYINRAGYDLRHYGQIAAGRPTYAIVDLKKYSTPQQVRATFGEQIMVVRAYARVPAKLPTEVRSVPVNDLDELERGLTTVASVAQATARSYAALLRTFHPTSREDRLTKRRYAEQRRAAVHEQHRYAKSGKCRCIFAVVVQARFPALAALASDDAIRVVDAASPVIPLTGLTIRPLEPQVDTVVPRTGLLGG